jgi:hypothetical protein
VFSVFVTAVIVLLIMSLIYFRGNRIIEVHEKTIRKIGCQDNQKIEKVAYVSYHGGLPKIPKPQKLALALSESYILFVTNKGQAEKLPFSRWNNVEQFTTQKKHNPIRRSMILQGPINDLFFKDQKRHIIVIHCENCNVQKNHVLIEHNDLNQLREIFEQLSTKWKSDGRQDDNRMDRIGDSDNTI